MIAGGFVSRTCGERLLSYRLLVGQAFVHSPSGVGSSRFFQSGVVPLQGFVDGNRANRYQPFVGGGGGGAVALGACGLTDSSGGRGGVAIDAFVGRTGHAYIGDGTCRPCRRTVTRVSCSWPSGHVVLVAWLLG